MIDAIDCYGGEGLVSGLSCGAKIKKKISKKIELGVLKVFLAASVGVARFFGRHNRCESNSRIILKKREDTLLQFEGNKKVFDV
jgi:hypothetical protein